MSPNDKHAPVFDHVLLYVIEQFDRFAVGQRRAGLIGSFGSESDLATAYEALLPFLDTEVVDTVAISRAGFRPPAVLEVRLLLEREAKCPAFLAAAGMDGWINRQSGVIVGVIDSLFDSMRATDLLQLTPFHDRVFTHFTAKYSNDQFASVFASLVFSVIQRFERLIVDYGAPC
jgi:hypothetical protein